jgi:hypothetical protein
VAFQPFARRPAGVLLALSLLAACSDVPPTAPAAAPQPQPQPQQPAEALAALSCTVQVRTEAVACAPSTPSAGGASATILGGQGTSVRFAATNLRHDTAAGRFYMDVTVQNLLLNPMGAADPSWVTGVYAFFYAGPVSATGTVEVYRPDGEGMFTGGMQTYYHWPELLPRNGVSQPARWAFTVSPSVESFQFWVLVEADLMPLLVYDLATGGNRDVWRMALDGSDPVRLTTHTGDDRNPTAARGKVVFATFRNGKPDLYSVPLAGGAETRLTATSTISEGDPALSWDGTRLAYTSDVAIGVAKVWKASVDLTGAARATPASFGSEAEPEAAPAWSPFGTRLALVGTDNGSADVYDLALGGFPALLRGGTTAEVDPAWSPDGTRLVYTSNATGAGDLYMLRLSDGQVTRLTSGPQAESYATWTPNGRIVYLAFLSGGATELRWLNPDLPGSGGSIPAAGAPSRPHAVF